jgi:ribosomal protein L37AE/L43A
MRNFIRKKEDFTCDFCKTKVKGTGYTNHCPRCLYSKHVDEAIPGDRASGCQGLMLPIKVENHGQEYVLIHKCLKCGKETKNKTAKEDNFEEILKLQS